jgi:hypothetical protein
MTIEDLYKEVREAIDDCISQDECMTNSRLADLLHSSVKNISDDAILRAIREIVKAPNAKDYELEEMIKWANSLDEALSELEDKCPMCAGSGQRPQA